MPPPKKLDRVPADLRRRLADELRARGFGDHEAVTEIFNGWLEAEGVELSVGTTVVGDYSRLLKNQRDAAEMASMVLDDLGVEEMGDMQSALYQMLMTMSFQIIQNATEAETTLGTKEVMELGRMLKDIVSATGMMKKIEESERARIREEALAEERKRQAGALEEGVEAGVIEAEAAQAAREIMGFA